MISINTNLSSIIVQNNLKTSTSKLNEAIERMSTGAKLNHASDNAANYSISTNMNTKLSSLQVAQDNVGMGLDMVTTASESLNLVTDQLTRIRALAEQAANGTYGGQSLQAINAEANARLKECARVINTAEYNGISLFKGATLGETDAPNRVSQAESLTAGETYSIKDSADLVALQNFVNDGVDTTNITFNLTDDINMSGVTFRGIGTDEDHAFKGTFNGNDHTISNLTINTTEDNVGLFGCTRGATIKNVNVENCDITGEANVGGLVGDCQGAYAKNAYVSDCNVSGSVKGGTTASGTDIGGVFGCTSSGAGNAHLYVTDCSADVIVRTGYHGGGFVGYTGVDVTYKNCYSSGTVDGAWNGSHGGFSGFSSGSSVYINCYSNANVESCWNSAGFIAWGGGILTNCYATGNITGNNVSAFVNGEAQMERCFATGSITGGDRQIGALSYNTNSTLTDCVYNIDCNSTQIAGTLTNVAGLTLSDMQNPEIMATYGFTEENGWYFDGGLPQLLVFKPVETDDMLDSSASYKLQVGINADKNSQISMDFSFSINLSLSLATHEKARAALSTLDGYIQTVANQQTIYGAVQNRLESALEANATQIENLTSSRSTIQDADIAKESSKYIKQQILQQACATLLSTANQTPAIALQLI